MHLGLRINFFASRSSFLQVREVTALEQVEEVVPLYPDEKTINSMMVHEPQSLEWSLAHMIKEVPSELKQGV